MSERKQGITPFQSGQNTKDKQAKEPKVRVLADTSRGRFSPGHDPLMQSLSSGIPELPTKRHLPDVATFHSKGVSYKPDGEYGRIKGKTAKGTSYAPHTSRPGENAVGKNSNRHGDNALGRALNGKGSNAIGSPPNRKGSNAIGSNSNRAGGKSGYPAFTPRGGGKNV